MTNSELKTKIEDYKVTNPQLYYSLIMCADLFRILENPDIREKEMAQYYDDFENFYDATFKIVLGENHTQEESDQLEFLLMEEF